MTHWNELSRDTMGCVKLKHRKYTFSDVLEYLHISNSRLVRQLTHAQFDLMMSPSSDGLTTTERNPDPPYVAIPIFQTYQDCLANNLIQMVYGNHGEIFFSPHEVLEQYILAEPTMFWGFKLKDVSGIPHNGSHGMSYVFSEDSDSFSNWEASLNMDEIWEYFGLDGGPEKACLMGFFYLH